MTDRIFARRRVLLVAMASILLAGIQGVLAQSVDVRARDGFILKATYLSPEKPGPAALLIHQCNMDRHAWDGRAADLVRVGFHVLAPDLRGFGESKEQGTRVASEQWGDDLDAALTDLLSRRDVDRSHIAVVGASCGAAESSLLALRHKEIQALVLMSGQVNLDGRDYIAATSSLAVFGTATADDAPDSIRDAIAASRNPASVATIYPGADHGVDLFRAHAELRPAIINWLQARLRVGK